MLWVILRPAILRRLNIVADSGQDLHIRTQQAFMVQAHFELSVWCAPVSLHMWGPFILYDGRVVAWCLGGVCFAMSFCWLPVAHPAAAGTNACTLCVGLENVLLEKKAGCRERVRGEFGAFGLFGTYAYGISVQPVLLKYGVPGVGCKAEEGISRRSERDVRHMRYARKCRVSS